MQNSDAVHKEEWKRGKTFLFKKMVIDCANQVYLLVIPHLGIEAQSSECSEQN